MAKTIYQTKNGSVFKCNSCNKIHVDFMNLSLKFDNKEYKRFSDYIQNLDGAAWEQKNAHISGKRKIYIPVGHKNLTLIFDSGELLELKQLLQPLNKPKATTEQMMLQGMAFSFAWN